MTYKDVNILIVGGGINGLVASLILSRHNIKTIIVDAKNLSEKRKQRIDGRGVALSKGSEEILKQYGVWSHLLNHLGYIKKIIVTENKKKNHLEFDASGVGENHMGAIIEMDDFYDILLAMVHADHNIVVHDNSKVLQIKTTENASFIKTDKNNYSAKLVLAADGKDSIFKKLLDVQSVESDYNQIAAVFNISHNKEHLETAYEIFCPNGPLAILPTKEQHISSVVWVEKREMSHLFDKKNHMLLNEVLKERLANTHGEMKIISELNFYPLFLKLSKRYSQNNILFLGDSLHYLHPIAGQGFNLSLRDIVQAADLIKNYTDSGFNPNNILMFEEYTRSRIADNVSMAMFTDSINRLFSNNSNMMKQVRNFGLDLVSQSSLISNFFVKQAMGKGVLHV